jgi:hypothetical protein
MMSLTAMRLELEKRALWGGIPPVETAKLSPADAALLKKHFPRVKNPDDLHLEDARGAEEMEALNKKAEARTLDGWAEHFAGRIKEAVAKEKKPDHPAKTLAKGVVGLGGGIGAGYLGMKGLQKMTGGTAGPLKGSKLMWAVPAITGAGGLIYSQMQGQMLDKMRRDHLARQETKRGSKES